MIWYHFLNTPNFVSTYNDNAVQKIISSPKLFISKFLYTTTHQTHLLESHKDLQVVSDVVSEEDVSTLDVEADAEEEADAPEEADVEEQVEEEPAEESEDDQAMNGDPTRFGGDNFSTEFVPAAQVP